MTLNECKDPHPCAECGKMVELHQVENDAGRIAVRSAGAVLTDCEGGIVGFSCSAACSAAWLSKDIPELDDVEGDEEEDEEAAASTLAGFMTSV